MIHLQRHLAQTVEESPFFAALTLPSGDLTALDSDSMMSGDGDVAAIADEDQAQLLRLPSPAAVLIGEQTTYLDSGQVIEHARSIFRADRYKLHTRTC
jgi:hypothetical protein